MLWCQEQSIPYLGFGLTQEHVELMSVRAKLKLKLNSTSIHYSPRCQEVFAGYIDIKNSVDAAAAQRSEDEKHAAEQTKKDASLKARRCC